MLNIKSINEGINALEACLSNSKKESNINLSHIFVRLILIDTITSTVSVLNIANLLQIPFSFTVTKDATQLLLIKHMNMFSRLLSNIANHVVNNKETSIIIRGALISEILGPLIAFNTKNLFYTTIDDNKKSISDMKNHLKILSNIEKLNVPSQTFNDLNSLKIKWATDEEHNYIKKSLKKDEFLIQKSELNKLVESDNLKIKNKTIEYDLFSLSNADLSDFYFPPYSQSTFVNTVDDDTKEREEMNNLLKELLTNNNENEINNSDARNKFEHHQSLNSIANDDKFSYEDTPLKDYRHLDNKSLASTPYLNQLKHLDSHTFLAKFPISHKINSDEDESIDPKNCPRTPQNNNYINSNTLEVGENYELLDKHLEESIYEKNMENMLELNNIDDVKYIHQLCVRILQNDSKLEFINNKIQSAGYDKNLTPSDKEIENCSIDLELINTKLKNLQLKAEVQKLKMESNFNDIFDGYERDVTSALDEITILRNKNIETESKHLALLDVHQQLLNKFELDSNDINRNINLSKQTLRVGYLIKDIKIKYSELESDYKSLKKKEREYSHRKHALEAALKKNSSLKQTLYKKENNLLQQSILLTSCEEKIINATIETEKIVKENLDLRIQYELLLKNMQTERDFFNSKYIKFKEQEVLSKISNAPIHETKTHSDIFSTNSAFCMLQKELIKQQSTLPNSKCIDLLDKVKEKMIEIEKEKTSAVNREKQYVDLLSLKN